MIILLISALAVLFHGLLKQNGIIRVPTLIALLYLTWFVPQMYAVESSSYGLIPGLSLLVAMATLSLVASWLGWYGNLSRSARTFPSFEFPKSTFPLVVLTLLSVVLNLVLYSFRESLSGVSQWSGPATIVAFFAQIRDIALALSLLLAFRQPKKTTIILLIINLCVSLPVAFYYLRRSEMIAIGGMLLAGAWFGKRLQVRIFILLPALCALAIVVYVIGPLRGEAARILAETGERVSIFSPQIWANIDPIREVKRALSISPDVTNAAYILRYRTDTFSFQYGATLWNAFIELYVPGQLVGYDLKNALKFSSSIGSYDEIRLLYSYVRPNGTTSTGFGSAYTDFWFIGSLYFFAMSWLMKRLFDRASNGNLWAQTTYMVLLASVLVAFTHGHQRFFISAIFLVFVIACVKMASRYRYTLRHGHRFLPRK